MSNYAKTNPQGEKNRIASLPKGSDHWNFSKDPSRPAIHKWINRFYGKANGCENADCDGSSKYYEWALIKGKKYAKIRSHFKMLCRKCHTKYDMTKERKANIVAGIKKRYER